MTIETDPQQDGIQLTVDVLDERQSPMDEVLDRLTKIKDIEDDLYEACITERTRTLNGIIDSVTS